MLAKFLLSFLLGEASLLEELPLLESLLVFGEELLLGKEAAAVSSSAVRSSLASVIIMSVLICTRKNQGGESELKQAKQQAELRDNPSLG